MLWWKMHVIGSNIVLNLTGLSETAASLLWKFHIINMPAEIYVVGGVLISLTFYKSTSFTKQGPLYSKPKDENFFLFNIHTIFL